MPQFDVSSFSSQLFWLFVAFTIFYFIVSKLIAPAAESILVSRNRFMQDNVNSADEYNQKSAEIEKLKAKTLYTANIAAEKIRHEALLRLEEDIEERKLETIKELQHKTDYALSEVVDFADHFHEKEGKPCLELASHIIHKVTGRTANMELLNKIEQDYSKNNNQTNKNIEVKTK